MKVISRRFSQSIHRQFLCPSFLKGIHSVAQQSDAFVGYSIFRPDFGIDTNSLVLNFAKSPYKDNIKIDRSLGSFMGHAIGDSLGSGLEFEHIDYTRKCLTDFEESSNANKFKPGQYTDDFAMTLCLADSLLWCNGLSCVDLRIRFLRWWFYGYNNGFNLDSSRPNKYSVGLGVNISESFIECFGKTEISEATQAGNQNTNGNGTIMRLSPVPIFFHENLKDAIIAAEKQSFTTHKGLEAADCAKVLSYMIWHALNCTKPCTGKGFAKEFLDRLDVTPLQPFLLTESAIYLSKSMQEPWTNIKQNKYCKTELDRNWNWKMKNYKYSPTRAKLEPTCIGGYAMDGLSMALHCVYHSNTAEEAILKATNLGGDADTVAAIAGQLAGAIYGISRINPEWSMKVLQWDNGIIPLRVLCMLDPKLRHEAVITDNTS